MKIRQILGFSLVESMLSILLGAILLGSMWSAFTDLIRIFNVHNEQAFLHSGGRYVSELFARDVRMSGFTGCSPSSVIRNVLQARQDGSEWKTMVGEKIVGYSAGSSGSMLIDSNATSSALVVNRVLLDERYSVLTHDSDIGVITLLESHNFNSGDILVMIDKNCEQVSFFKAGSGTSGNTIEYHISDGSDLYNCSRLIKGEVDCGNSEMNVSLSNVGLSIFPVEMVAYYVRDFSGIPTLYRKRAGLSISNEDLTAEPLVEGVEDLHFLYGYDANADGTVDQYISANDIENTGKKWKLVNSIRLDIVMRSIKEVLYSTKFYMLKGNTYSHNDLYLRKVITKFISLRN